MKLCVLYSLTLLALATAAPVVFSGNGHAYEIISSAGSKTWTNAKLDASTRTFNGQQGYLATVTCPEEWNFIKTLPEVGGSPSNLWLGGAMVGSSWQWVGGPEAGQQFSSASQCLPSHFCAWSNGEPSGGTETVLMTWPSGNQFWNDGHDSSALSRWLVEYGTSADPDHDNDGIPNCMDTQDCLMCNNSIKSTVCASFAEGSKPAGC